MSTSTNGANSVMFAYRPNSKFRSNKIEKLIGALREWAASLTVVMATHRRYLVLTSPVGVLT